MSTEKISKGTNPLAKAPRDGDGDGVQLTANQRMTFDGKIYKVATLESGKRPAPHEGCSQEQPCRSVKKSRLVGRKSDERFECGLVIENALELCQD